MAANRKKGNGKMIVIGLLVCIAAAGIFLIAYMNKGHEQPDPLVTPSQQPSEVTPVLTPEPSITAASETSSPSAVLPKLNLSTWVAEWQWEAGVDDLKKTSKIPDSVQAFAANFVLDKINIPENLASMIVSLKEIILANPDTDLYLSLTNDRQDESGTWTEKDSGLIDRLMVTKETRSAHIAEILALVDTYGLSGIEIDYEKVSDGAWQNYCLFCGELYQALAERNVALRIVLEPSSPIENSGLAEGPEYVMMAYNLYGSGTQPGPKADFEFIREMAVKMENLPGEKRIAFATGGYKWDSGGETTSLTETEAYDLSQASILGITRDEGSGALYFTYMADQEKEYTVWYADGETLKGWIELSRSLGYENAAIWSMGGTRLETLQILGEMVAED